MDTSTIMNFFNFINTPIFTFSDDELQNLADVKASEYLQAKPFPNAVFNDFLQAKVAERVLDVFPAPDDPIWLDWKKRDTTHQPKKLGIGHASRLEGVTPYLQNILFAFNSYPFLHFLEKLTGIEKLLPDPHFYGGGIHQTLSGGKLAIHTDFNHLHELDLYRRINVILFLNKNWKPEYGGNLELWDESKTKCEKIIEPLFNTLAVFETNKKTFHGHPEPLNTPMHITRKSLALYYYTSQPNPNENYDRKTDWVDKGNGV